MRQVVIQQIEILANGCIQIKMQKQFVDEGEVMSEQPHRCMVCPGDDIDAMKDAVNDHLKQMKWPTVDESEWERVKAHSEVAWTPECCKAWAQAVETAQAARLDSAEAAT